MPSNPTTPAMPPRTLNLVVGLIRDYLGLASDQVVVYNQKWKVPSDDRIYITVGLLAAKCYASYTTTEPFTDAQGRSGLKEITTLNSQEALSVNILSRGQAAVLRRDEVVLAFGSTMAEQLAEANQLKFGSLPVGYVDLSTLEGTAMVNRYGITVNVLCARTQERVIEYFSQFQTPALVIEP